MAKRELNIECFRFLATIFVIILHILGQGGILENAVQGGLVYWTAWLLEVTAFCSVNCFALITGYVMANKNTNMKTIISLWLKVAFYSLVLSGIIFAIFPESISIKRIVTALLPITGQQWWYISSYFALFFTIPFLNAGIRHISREDYIKLLIIILIGVCVVSCILPIDAFTLNNGYSAIWLIIVYLFGAYISKYKLEKNTTALKSILSFSIVVLITFVSKVSIYYLTKGIYGEPKYDGKLISYTSVTILLASIYLFLFFLNIKINDSKFSTKIVEFFSLSALGTYLIHTHPLVFDFIIKDSFVWLSNESPLIMTVCVIGGSFVIFVLCGLIEILRTYLFEIAKINKLSETIDNGINNLYVKIAKQHVE